MSYDEIGRAVTRAQRKRSRDLGAAITRSYRAVSAWFGRVASAAMMLAMVAMFVVLFFLGTLSALAALVDAG